MHFTIVQMSLNNSLETLLYHHIKVFYVIKLKMANGVFVFVDIWWDVWNVAFESTGHLKENIYAWWLTGNFIYFAKTSM